MIWMVKKKHLLLFLFLESTVPSQTMKYWVVIVWIQGDPLEWASKIRCFMKNRVFYLEGGAAILGGAFCQHTYRYRSVEN